MLFVAGIATCVDRSQESISQSSSIVNKADGDSERTFYNDDTPRENNILKKYI